MNTTQEPVVPDVLKKKLVFGDCDQILALREYESQVAEKELHEQVGEEKEYRVYVEIEYSEYVNVTAKSLKEAEEIASDDFSIHDCDYEFHVKAEEI